MTDDVLDKALTAAIWNEVFLSLLNRLRRELAARNAQVIVWRDAADFPHDGKPYAGVREDGSFVKCFWHPEFGIVSRFNRMTMADGYTIDGKEFKDHSPVVEKITHFAIITPPAVEGEP